MVSDRTTSLILVNNRRTEPQLRRPNGTTLQDLLSVRTRLTLGRLDSVRIKVGVTLTILNALENGTARHWQ